VLELWKRAATGEYVNLLAVFVSNTLSRYDYLRNTVRVIDPIFTLGQASGDFNHCWSPAQIVEEGCSALMVGGIVH
jgi:hypothetical protein